MLQVHLICVGKLKESFYLAACQEYAKRLSGSCKLVITELPEVRLSESPSPGELDAALSKEASMIREHLPKGTHVTALCIEGKTLSSEDFSKQLDQLMLRGVSGLALVIGGSFGLHPTLKARADWRLSMSSMTFPHHLARVMLLEQLYRAFQISKGGRYHK